jgi:tRNA/rRNA methyltransferase
MANKPDALGNVRVVLVGTSHPGNIGAAARAMKTMGLADLRLVAPQRFPDPQARAMASNALDVLENAQVCASLDEALAGCVHAAALTARRRELMARFAAPREAAPQLIALAGAGPVAVVFGNETSGLTAAQAERCQTVIRIPANPEYSSLNLAAAVQIVAYELRLAAGAGSSGAAAAGEAATLDEVERFYAHLEETLRDIGVLDPRHPKKILQRLRRLYAKAELEKEEVSLLRGILRATQDRNS